MFNEGKMPRKGSGVLPTVFWPTLTIQHCNAGQAEDYASLGNLYLLVIYYLNFQTFIKSSDMV
jgi:hypothetical protein